jgi:hypothetical protein
VTGEGERKICMHARMNNLIKWKIGKKNHPLNEKM